MATTLSSPKTATATSIARSIIVDVSILGGAALLAYGSWLAYPPAGFIVGGLVVLCAGLNGSRR